MNSIKIFEKFATEQYIRDLEEESKTYEGLYVDMEDKEQRKFVKDQASLIGDILKKIDRERIDISKNFKKEVETEADSIKLRLEKANEPFTLLIDEHKKARAKILADKKAIEDRKQALIDFDNDHEFALLMDIKFDTDAKQAAELRLARDEQIRLEAIKQAKIEQQKKFDDEQAEIKRVADEKAADIDNQKYVNGIIIEDLMALGLSHENSVLVMKGLVKSKVRCTQVNY